MLKVAMVFSKRPPLLVTVGAALLFVGGGAAAFWLTSRRGAASKYLPVGAEAIPADAVAVLSLSTDEGQWRRLRQFGTAETQAQLDRFLARWYRRTLSDHDLSFKPDVAPWIGPEVTLAVLPQRDGSGLALPDPDTLATVPVALMIPIADATRAQTQLAEQLEAVPDLEDNPYRGVAIQQLPASGSDPVYGAVLSPQLAVVSPQIAVIQRVIDAERGGGSLANRGEVVRAFEELQGGIGLGRFYLDVPTTTTTLAGLSDPPLGGSQLERLQVPRGMAGRITVNNKGLVIQSISWLEGGGDTFTPGNSASQMPQKLPADTLVMVSTGNLEQLWQDLEAGPQWSALLPFEPAALELGLQVSTGLALTEDVLPWMDGEVALGVLAPAVLAPASEGAGAGDPLPNPALVLLAQVSDRAAAETAFKQLNSVLEGRYRYAVDSQDVGGIPMTRWQSPFGAITLTQGWLEGDVAFFALGEGVASQIAPKPNRPLATTSQFQATTGAAPRPNNGHFFLNLEAMAGAEANLLLPPLPQEGLISTNVIQAIGVTATVLGERQVRYDIVTTLRSGPRPGPLPLEPGESAPTADPDNASDSADSQPGSPANPPNAPDSVQPDEP